MDFGIRAVINLDLGKHVHFNMNNSQFFARINQFNSQRIDTIPHSLNLFTDKIPKGDIIFKNDPIKITFFQNYSFEIIYKEIEETKAKHKYVIEIQSQPLPEFRERVQKYKDLLGVCIEKQKIATLDEVDAILGMTRFFSFNVDDFI